MTQEQGAAVITILKCWLGASVLASLAVAGFQVALWLGVVLSGAALLVALIALLTSASGPSIEALTKDR